MGRLAPALALVALACSSAPAIPPQPTSYVTDPAPSLLSLSAHEKLEEELVSYKHRTKHELIVWISHKDPGDIPSFTFNAFNAWGIGRAGTDDGLAVFVWPDQKKAWITVGYGLESKGSDREATRIVTEIGAPLFRQGKPDLAVSMMVSRLIELTDETAH